MRAARILTQCVPTVSQGDILRDIEMIEWVERQGKELVVSRIVFPLVIVLTQDCELTQDYGVRWSRINKPKNQDKMLMSVLVSPIYIAEHVLAGEHLSELKQAMRPIKRKSTEWTNITQNQTPRYHYLRFPATTDIPDAVIDFKHYFSVNVPELKAKKKRHFIAKIAPVYREDIAHRFASYISRVALPD
jgi:hypothetical protein